LPKVADIIDDVLRTDFRLSDAEPNAEEYYQFKRGVWTRRGVQVGELISELAGVDERISEAVRALLSDRYRYRATKDGEEDPYDHEAHYEDIGPYDGEYRSTWEALCQNVRWRSRFLSETVKGSLDHIFGNLTSLRTIGRRGVLRNLTPRRKNGFLYRARVAFSERELKEILADPHRQLGPPPPIRARAGRMNAGGISVFYGATDIHTCVAEVRPPVGSRVIVGRFALVRPIRLLDLDALKDVYVDGSHFDPSYQTRRDHAKFLERLVRTISRPVLPEKEDFEYLPTQVVSEYLSNIQPQVDGIVFRSAQRGGKGRNVVLFHNASVVSVDDTPEFKREVHAPAWDDHEDEYRFYMIVDTKPSKEPTEAIPAKVAFDPLGTDLSLPTYSVEDTNLLPERLPTVKLDADSIHVLEVNSVRYGHSAYKVVRREQDEDDEPIF
jgi:hypothetical protein